MPPDLLRVTGRCYCGTVSVSAEGPPEIVTYCHCQDCRRITGAPVAAFAAFPDGAVSFSPSPGPAASANPGVTRWFCRDCGSPLAAQFDYLPGQIYLPVGILDQAEAVRPTLHCHADAQLPWLTLDDGVERVAASGRRTLLAR